MVPVVIAHMIDVGIAENNRGVIIRSFLILILMAGAGLTVSITAQFCSKASTGFAAELRQSVFDHVQGLSYSELDRLGTATLITRLTNDINQVQNGLNMGLRLLLRSPFIVLGSMVMAFTINVRCALVFVVAIPVLFLVVLLLCISAFRFSVKFRESLTELQVLQEKILPESA